MAARAAGAVAALVLVAGCAAPPRVELQTVAVEVPVPCRVAVPERPVMPTEALAPGVPLDSLVAAALAEIERREAYELLLRAALEACRK